MTVGTWDLTRRQRMNNDLHVGFADGGFSRPRSEREMPGTVSEAATILQVGGVF